VVRGGMSTASAPCSGTPHGVPSVPTYGASDGWLQRTTLCADKIAAILNPGIGPTVFPIYGCAAAERQAVRLPSAVPFDKLHSCDYIVLTLESRFVAEAHHAKCY